MKTCDLCDKKTDHLHTYDVYGAGAVSVCDACTVGGECDK
jgi:hypothetical protein